MQDKRFFFPLFLSLGLEQMRRLWIEAPCLVRSFSLLCKWVLGFYLAELNTWAQVLPDESQLIEVCAEWNIRLGKSWSRRSNMGLSFLFLRKAEVEITSILVVCFLHFLCPPTPPPTPPRLLFCVRQENLNLKSSLKHGSRWSSPGQLYSEPAAYLQGWTAAAGSLESFCLHKHPGPLEAE